MQHYSTRLLTKLNIGIILITKGIVNDLLKIDCNYVDVGDKNIYISYLSRGGLYLIIQHNMIAAYADLQLRNINKNKAKFEEKLSTGYRINRAADDAAGLTISEKMRAQIRGLDTSSENIEEGKLYCNVAEGALSEVHSMLDKLKEIAVQAANDTNTTEDRLLLDDEVQQIKEEINSVFRNTEYNTIKIWQAAYVPEVGGICKDFSLYNVEDANGSYSGGIVYMNHRYSWGDLGINNWDATTHTFTSTAEFTIDAAVLHNNGLDIGDPSTNDNYISVDNSGAIFTINTMEGSTTADIKKSYSWSADDKGIYIDHVMTTDPDPHSETGNTTWTSMGLTAGDYVNEGTYTFKYYGMEVSFDVPSGGDTWEDFLGGFNNSIVKIDWHSEYFTTDKVETVECTNASQIFIDSSNKDYISTDLNPYTIRTDEDGIWITNNGDMKKSLGKDGAYEPSGSLVRWEELINQEGYPINSWGIDTDNNGSTNQNNPSNADGGDTKITISSDDIYTYLDDSLGSSFLFSFHISEDASRTAVMKDLNNSTFKNLGVISPTQISSYTPGTGDFVSSGNSAMLSFITQRDIFYRNFSSPNEEIAKGGISEKAGYFTLELSEANSESILYTLTSTRSRSELETEISNYIVNKMYDLYNSALQSGTPVTELSDTSNPDNALLGLENYTMSFVNYNDTVSLNLDLSKIQYGAIISPSDASAGKTPEDPEFLSEVSTYVANNMDLFLDSELKISGNGLSYQELWLQENSVFDDVPINVPVVGGCYLSFNVQSGANTNEKVAISYDYLRLGSLGMKTTNVLTRNNASTAITSIDKAIEKVSQQRSLFGAYRNQLEYAYSVNSYMYENMQAAESKIRDADMAKEVVNNLKYTILEQAGQAVLAQANQYSELMLSLLR